MTKNPRDERVWTNSEVQEDAQGYLTAQLRRKQDEDAELRRRHEQDDKARFVEEFVSEGGDPADAKAVWKEIRNDRAAEAARHVEEAARQQTRQHVARSL